MQIAAIRRHEVSVLLKSTRLGGRTQPAARKGASNNVATHAEGLTSEQEAFFARRE